MTREEASEPDQAVAVKLLLQLHHRFVESPGNIGDGELWRAFGM